LKEVVWARPALAELTAIQAYLEQFNPHAARAVAVSLKDLGDSLAHFPLRGRRVPGTALRELVSHYPYIIRYAIDGDTVVILRVRHSARRPTNP
jgi:plasmid stabilization system protein ParE